MTLPIRIGFSGASGTGKSTLTKWVSEKYGLQIHPITTRGTAAKMGLVTPYEADQVGRRAELQRMLFKERYEWEQSDEAEKGFVSERTHFDNLAYSVLHCHEDIDDPHLAVVLMAQRVCYTHIFLLNPEHFINIAGDPARKVSSSYHSVYDAVLRGLYQKHGIAQVFTIPHSDIDARKGFIAQTLERWR